MRIGRQFLANRIKIQFLVLDVPLDAVEVLEGGFVLQSFSPSLLKWSVLLPVHRRDLPLQRGVKVVLNRVVRAAKQQFGYFRPLVAKLLVRVENYAVLLFSPFTVFNIRIQMVMPPLSALLADPAVQFGRDETPVFSAVLVHEVDDGLVFFFCPRPFDQTGVEDLLPPMQALHVRPVVEELGDLISKISPRILTRAL